MTFFVGVGPRLMHKIPANGKHNTSHQLTLSAHLILAPPYPNYTLS